MTSYHPEESVLKSWAINHRILIQLLDGIPNEAINVTLSRKGSRTIADQFMHMHSVRMMWSEVAEKKKAADKKTGNEELTKDFINKSLENSYLKIEELIKIAFLNDGKVKGAGMDVISFVSYLISHESHHRGNILLTLKVSGYPISKELSYSFWDWKKP